MLNNLAAAEALLRLFNVELTWEQVKDLGPNYAEPLRSIVRMVQFIDEQRAGELITSDPTPELLQAAYDADYRLGFTQSKCKCCGTIDSMLHIVKPTSPEDQQTKAVMDSTNYDQTWRELRTALYGAPEPKTCTLKDMGETIINQLSKNRALHQDMVIQNQLKPIKDLHRAFPIKRLWKLPSIDLKQINKLQSLLQQTVLEVCGTQVEIKLSLSPLESLGIINYHTDTYGFNSYTNTLCLNVKLNTRSIKQLDDVDFSAVLHAFYRKAELLPASELTFRQHPDNYPTKDKYYARFFRSNGKNVPEHISPAQLKAMIQADIDSRAPRKP